MATNIPPRRSEMGANSVYGAKHGLKKGLLLFGGVLLFAGAVLISVLFLGVPLDKKSEQHASGESAQDRIVPAKENVSTDNPLSSSQSDSPKDEVQRADLVIHINEYPFLPIPDITREVAGKLCAVAAGHLCLWGEAPLQQSYSLGTVITDDELDFAIERSSSVSHTELFTFAELQEEKYRAFVLGYDIMGRVHSVDEAHFVDAYRKDGRVTLEWDHQISRRLDGDKIGIKTLAPQTAYDLVIVGTESGGFGRTRASVPGATDNRGMFNARPYIPNHADIFVSKLLMNNRGRLIDGGEGYDTVEYTDPSYKFDFARATTSPRFLNPFGLENEDGEIQTSWFYKNYDRAIVVVSGVDRVDILLSIEAIRFSDNTYEVDDLMQALESSDGVIYGEKGPPQKGIAY